MCHFIKFLFLSIFGGVTPHRTQIIVTLAANIIKLSQTYKYFYEMKPNVTFLIVLAFTLFGCEETQSVKEYKSGGRITYKNEILSTTRDFFEFEFKGHLYIGCNVRDGISLTHAGHCKCNKK